MWNFWYAVSVLVGTIVGVGMFGLPYAAWHAGFFVELMYLATFTLVFIALHLMFGEVILRTNAKHNLLGYAALYLGERSKQALRVVDIAGTVGGMMAYLLVGGEFLRIIADGFFPYAWQAIVVFWFMANGILFFGLKAIERSEAFMLAGMVVAIAVLWIVGFPLVQSDYFFNSNADSLLFPYGITLFALAGTAAIPLVRDILRKQEGQMKRVIVMGTLIPAIFYALFIFLVVGITGPATSENALSGLGAHLGSSFIFLGALFGVFVVITSYIVFGLYLKESLRYDLKISPRSAAFAMLAVPLALTLVQNDGFVTLVNFLGAVFGGLWALFLIALHQKAKNKGDRTPEYTLHFSRATQWLLSSFFVMGIIYTLFFDGRV